MRGRWPVTTADQVRAYVAARDVKCPCCRYNLRGLRDARCPECGKSLDVLTLHGQRGWICSTIPMPGFFWTGLWMNVGLAIAIVVSATNQHGRMPLLSWTAPAVLGAFLVCLNYGAVFIRRDALPCSGLWPEWSAASTWFLAALQTVGLVLMWV